MAEMTASLSAKPFGKDGVRLVYSGASEGAVLEVRSAGADDDAAWHEHAAVSGEGVLVVKVATAASGPPRSAEWRLRSGSIATAPISHSRQAGAPEAPAASAAAAISRLNSAELAYNVLQWFGTIAIDLRPAPSGQRLRESVAVVDADAAAALPLKDDAVCVESTDTPEGLLPVVGRRVRRSIYLLSEALLDELCTAHPCLGGDAAERRPVLPNLVGGSLLVGHQGHALCMADWASLVPLGGVVNLAPDKVDAEPARAAVAAAVAAGRLCTMTEVRCADGLALTDKPGDGERLLEVLPATLEAIAEASRGGPVFVHCQQGRSRAGSLAAAHLLATHDGWSLCDAVRFLAARRPETEIQQSYIEALERWAVGSLGRPPSLPQLREDLPKALRPDPLNRRSEMRGSHVDGGAPAVDASAPSAADLAAPSAERSQIGTSAADLPASPLVGRGSFGAAAVRRAGTVGKLATAAVQ